MVKTSAVTVAAHQLLEMSELSQQDIFTVLLCHVVYSYSGTNKFRVEIADTASGPWTTMVDSSLTDPSTYADYSCGILGISCSCPTCDNTRHDVPIENFDVGLNVGRYVKFVCDSYHGDITCALHYIQLL